MCKDPKLETASLIAGSVTPGPSGPSCPGKECGEHDASFIATETSWENLWWWHWGVAFIPFVCFGILIAFVWVSRWNEILHHTRNHLWRRYSNPDVWEWSFFHQCVLDAGGNGLRHPEQHWSLHLHLRAQQHDLRVAPYHPQHHSGFHGWVAMEWRAKKESNCASVCRQPFPLQKEAQIFTNEN